MKGTVLYGPHDVRFDERDLPKIEKPMDAVIRIFATCLSNKLQKVTAQWTKAERSKRGCVRELAESLD